MNKLLITLLLFCGASALADVPHKFHAGEKARADEVNENFEYVHRTTMRNRRIIEANKNTMEAFMSSILQGLEFGIFPVMERNYVRSMANATAIAQVQLDIDKKILKVYDAMWAVEDWIYEDIDELELVVMANKSVIGQVQSDIEFMASVAMATASVIEDIKFILVPLNSFAQQAGLHIVANIGNIQALEQGQCDSMGPSAFGYNTFSAAYIETSLGQKITSIINMYESEMMKIALQHGSAIFHVKFPVDFDAKGFDVALVTPTESQRKCTHFLIDGYEYYNPTNTIEYRAFIEPVIANHFIWEEVCVEDVCDTYMIHRKTTTVKLNIHVRDWTMIVFTFTWEAEQITELSDDLILEDDGAPRDFTGSEYYNPSKMTIDTVIETLDDFVDVLRIEDWQ